MNHGTLWRQIRVATKMRLGIDTGSLLRLPDALQFDVRCPRSRRFTVRLNGADLYDIEFGRMDMQRLEYVPLATSLNVHVADLNRTLLRLAGLEG
jgi:hypothetical protein